MDYELEDGTMLHMLEWNGEVYTTKNNGREVSYRPVQIHNENQDAWETIGFERLY